MNLPPINENLTSFIESLCYEGGCSIANLPLNYADRLLCLIVCLSVLIVYWGMLIYNILICYATIYIHTNILTICKCFICTQYLNVFYTRYSRFPLYFITPQLQPVCTVFIQTKFTASLHCSHLQLVYAVHSYNTIAAGLHCTFSRYNYSRFALYNVTPHLRPVCAIHFYTTITAGFLCSLMHHNYSWFSVYAHTPQLQLVYFVPSHIIFTASLHRNVLSPQIQLVYTIPSDTIITACLHRTLSHLYYNRFTLYSHNSCHTRLFSSRSKCFLWDIDVTIISLDAGYISSIM